MLCGNDSIPHYSRIFLTFRLNVRNIREYFIPHNTIINLNNAMNVLDMKCHLCLDFG